MRPRLGDEETGKMSDEELAVHRELQYLRAAGIAGSHRRSKRRGKPVNKSAKELEGWVEARADKLDEVQQDPPSGGCGTSPP